MCYLSLLHRHNNAEHLPIEESDESDYGEDEPLDDQEIDLEIGIHRIKKEEEVDLLTSDCHVLVYQRLKQKVQWEIRQANKKYMEEVSTDYKDNSKKFWSYIKSKGQEWIGVAPLKNKMGFLQSDNKSKVAILTEQFQSVFTKENLNNFPNKGKSPYSTKINSKGVHKLLKNMKPHKATVPDSIPSFILKAAADQLAPILTELYQISLNTGVVPQDLKDAHVVPLFKTDERHLASNYRPVSLTSITCKVMEHIVHSSVMCHFERNKILTNAQHGFRKKRSCESPTHSNHP